ncbi:MAG TPA: hypothetical protein VFQ43_00555 [Nitrososphaera sp.]|nr:MAG: hypothetical protein DMF63_02095 [Acidobacteriota bacterium]HEU0046075.1 hypothetical protein [Nitrososphaera sp.]
MKLLFLSLFAVLCFGISSLGQSNQNLTWPELKIVQKEERMALDAAQKDEQAKLYEIQKAQLDALLKTASQTGILDFAAQLREERMEMSRLHSEERKKLAETQSLERVKLVSLPKS